MLQGGLAGRTRLVRSGSLSEAERMQRVPGIVFVDGACGRRARIDGTGLDVFEVIKVYCETGGDRAELVEDFHWLSAAQLKAALDYNAAFPEEIDARLALENALTPEHLRPTA